MKLYKVFRNNFYHGAKEVDDWVRMNHKKYDYKVAGLTAFGNNENGGSILVLAFWPKSENHNKD